MKTFFAFLFLLLTVVSCSDGIKDDALRASRLMQKSQAATSQYDFVSAEKYFREFKDIQEKYKGTDKYEVFEQAYWECVTEGKN